MRATLSKRWKYYEPIERVLSHVEVFFFFGKKPALASDLNDSTKFSITHGARNLYCSSELLLLVPVVHQ